MLEQFLKVQVRGVFIWHNASFFLFSLQAFLKFSHISRYQQNINLFHLVQLLPQFQVPGMNIEIYLLQIKATKSHQFK